MLSGLLINGVLLPTLAGLATGIAAWLRAPKIAILLLATASILLAYLLLEGLPALPPAAVKQKLAYVFMLSGLVGLGALLAARRWDTAATGLIVLFAGFCVYWFGGTVFARAKDWLPLLAPTAYAVLVTACAALFLRSITRLEAEPVSHRLIAPATVLAFCIGSAIVALAGGFIGMGQMFGALSAVTGGILLAGYIAVLRGRGDLVPSPSAVVPVLVCAAVGTGIVVSFYATSLNIAAQMLLPFVFLAGAMLSGRGGLFERLPIAARPVATGALAAVPALLAALLAVVVPA